MRTLLTALFMTLATQVASQEVYYCQGLELAEWSTQEQKITTYTPQNFKFSIQHNQLKFGSGGYFNNTKMEITSHTGTMLRASGEIDMLTMDEGNFNYAFVSSDAIMLIAAKCDKF